MQYQPQYQTQYVGVWRRAVAVVLDLIIIGSLTGPIWLNSGLFSPSTQTTTTSGGQTVTAVVQFAANPWTGLLVAAVPFVYFTLLEGFFGATAGKMLLGLRVVQLNGSTVTWREAIVRNLLRPVDEIVFYLVAAISVWASPRKQRLGDRAAGTVVVRLVPVTLHPYEPVAPTATSSTQPPVGTQPGQPPMTSHN